MPFAAMLSAAGKLARIDGTTGIREFDILGSLKDFVARLNRKVFWFSLLGERTSDLAAMINGFLNHFGLARLVAFLFVIDDLQKSRDKLLGIFESIGSLDACIAVSSWLHDLPASAVPAFDESNEIGTAGTSGIIDAEGMYHPLIENAVGNSFSMRGESALITGSNMAGKTSFIKTIGINMILAQTIFIVLAERAVLPRRIVRTSIKREEQVLDGQSYYSREIELLREFLNCPENRCLFLIDEIFRGTNTIERVAISAATLRCLTHRNISLVTTHDIELQPLLADCARMFHFSEQVEGDRYYFDFILREGPCHAGNAIRLIELKGYPPSLVEEAKRLAEKHRLSKQ
jgi:DNA mismatch repair ATPase MutS